MSRTTVFQLIFAGTLLTMVGCSNNSDKKAPSPGETANKCLSTHLSLSADKIFNAQEVAASVAVAQLKCGASVDEVVGFVERHFQQ